MWLYMLFLFAGVVIGLYNKIPDKIIKKSQSFQLWGLILILFAMGISIGINRDIIRSFMVIGVQSVLLAAAAIAGSLVVVRMFRPIIQRKIKEKA